MQETILVLSFCQRRCRSSIKNTFYYKFHFKGFYLGSKIKEIHVYSMNETIFLRGEAYLLWVRHIRIENMVLEVNLIKHKEIR
jgi:hypothetical protein